MARIQIYHPDETINAKLMEAGYKNGQLIPESEVLDVVGKLFRETSLNIMIEHQGTEFTKIWVDKGTFLQLRNTLG